MHIIHIASELAPIAKVGGLADVIYGLSKELQRSGNVVEILLPKYDCLQFIDLKNLKVEHRELWVYEGSTLYNNTIWSAEIEGLKILLIEPHHPQYYFSRGVIYGCHDDIDRFTYFSRAALEYLFKSGKQPDVIHVHDWPTAIIPLLYKDLYRPLGYEIKGTVLTIHNMQHQGRCDPNHLLRMGLKPQNYLDPSKMQDPFNPQLINLLKGGIEFSDRLTTVSPNYEKEIQTPDGGFGLQETLVKNRRKLKGILNGIDEHFWNPEIDSHLIEKYPTHNITEEKLTHVIKGKTENKRQLRTHLHLKETNAPIVACISRLDPQKSPELIKHALIRTLEQKGQFILLGSVLNPQIRQEFEQLQKEYLGNENTAVLLDQDEALAHLIFAAADMFIIPSLFEPCGLTQLIALRYGTVPIARVTGGLADTVFDIDSSLKPFSQRNGFTFDFPDQMGVNWALDRAINCYSNDVKKWQTMMLNGMKMDFSWRLPALEYNQLYKDLYNLQAPLQKNRNAKKITRRIT